MPDLALATPLWLAVLGIAVNALVGALHAYTDDHRPWDVVGVLSFALLMGLGGGVVRDLLLGQLPPLSLRSPLGVVTVVAAAAAGRLLVPLIVRAARLMAVLEALALALFAISGAAYADAAGLPWTTSVLVAVVAAVGGGVLVSLLRGEVPSVLQAGRPDALLAAWAALAYLLLDDVSTAAASIVPLALAVGVRLLSDRRSLATRPLSRAATAPLA